MIYHKQKFEYALTDLAPWSFTVPTQTRFPRSKKKRIRRKWAKRPENFEERPLTAAKILAVMNRCREKMRLAIERRMAEELGWGTNLPQIIFEPGPITDRPITIRARFDVLPIKRPRFLLMTST